MNNVKMVVALGVVGALFLSGLARAEETVILKDEKSEISYSMGVQIGSSLRRTAGGMDPDILIRGIKDVLSESKLLMTPQEMRDTMTAFQKEEMRKRDEYEKNRKTSAETNKKEGEAFLAENKGKEGVVTLPSGLQYKVLRAGTGETPTDEDSVAVHYRGTLLDGTECFSSHRRGEPAMIRVKTVFQGWYEALKLMQPGAKWQLFIPSGLAFGEVGSGRVIGPNATLILEVELISISKTAVATGQGGDERSAPR
jgi:FKBP-type peptidyl-prolyl cis-trans isomerase FklB